MSISYARAIKGATASVTLGSVVGWNGTLDIVKDPPKSITTTRRDKVTDTQDYFLEANDSDRFCQSVSVYPRGVNPFASVSYSNDMNMGGGGGGNQPMASNPYKVMKDGAFRWEELVADRLTPVSKQTHTISYTAPSSSVDYTKLRPHVPTPQETFQVRTETLKVSARPTKVLKIERPIEAPYEVRYAIQNPITVSASSGVRPTNVTMMSVGVPVKGAACEFPNVYPSTNIGAPATFQPDGNGLRGINEAQYIQDPLRGNVSTNASVPFTPGATAPQEVDRAIRDTVNVSYSVPKTGSGVSTMAAPEYELTRNLPAHSVTSSTTKQGDGTLGVETRGAPEQSRNLPAYFVQTNTSSIGENRVGTQEYTRLKAGLDVGGYTGRTQGVNQGVQYNLEPQTSYAQTKKDGLFKATHGTSGKEDFRSSRYKTSAAGIAASAMHQKNSHMVR